MTTPAATRTLIRFGTDGWRAIIADTFTFENVRYCAEGVVSYLKAAGLAAQGLVVGYDTRFASEDFAAATAEVAASHGIDVWLFDRPAPTPMGCYAVVDKKAGGAVMITASHNPGSYNGFKYKTQVGGSAPPDIVVQIEAGLDAAQLAGPGSYPPLEQLLAASDAPSGRGRVRLFDPNPAYDANLRRLVDLSIVKDAGLSIVYDAMHSTGAGILARLLEGGKTKLTELRGRAQPGLPRHDLARTDHPQPHAAGGARRARRRHRRAGDGRGRRPPRGGR